MSGIDFDKIIEEYAEEIGLYESNTRVIKKCMREACIQVLDEQLKVNKEIKLPIVKKKTLSERLEQSLLQIKEEL